MEEDERSDTVKDKENERSVMRIFSLTDAVFAIAMTLLVLDLKVPDLNHPTNSLLLHKLGEQSSAYLAFLLSFYVIANYWRRHHRLMRTVRASDPSLVRRTILLLLAISVMPFAAELLGSYGGSAAIAITVYALVNALALGALLLIDHELAARHLSSDQRSSTTSLDLWCDLIAFLFAVVAAYALEHHGLVSMIVLLLLSGIVARVIGRRRDRRAALLVRP